jgi:SAM-dependent methyltransferase
VSKPFIIWTMQRTGGTALTDMLMQMSEHRAAEHEPFNWGRKTPRQFWPIADAWNKSRDVPALAASLAEIFAQNYLIKHCYELLSASFNEQFMLAAARTPYRHVHLLRRDEPGRLVSKFIAEANGTWFTDYARRVYTEVAEGRRALAPLPVEEVVAHFRRCRTMTRAVASWLAELGPESRVVYYEDLYVGSPAERLARMHDFLDFLGFTAEEVAAHEGTIAATLFEAGQDTRSVAAFVPNLDAVMTALAEAGCGPDGAPAAGGGGVKPVARMAAEFSRLVALQAPAGPFLEIASGPPTLVGPPFEGQERHVLGAAPPGGAPGITFHAGEPSDLRGLFPDGRFATVVWNDALAHERQFWLCLAEIWRVLAPGGLLVLAAPGFSKAANRAGVTVQGPQGRAIADVTPTYRVHASPDYWRFSPQAMTQVLLAGYEIRQVKVSSMPPRIFGVGVKPADGRPLPAGAAAPDQD